LKYILLTSFGTVIGGFEELNPIIYGFISFEDEISFSEAEFSKFININKSQLFEYLKDSHDYVIIETSPVLRAYFKTELTIRQSDPKKILKERR